MKTFAIVKGTSGTGKSTRVYQLLLFLRDFKKMECKEIKLKHSRKETVFGFLIQPINLLIVGREYYRFRRDKFAFGSMDMIHKDVGTMKRVDELLEKLSQNHSILLEASGFSISPRYRPKHLIEKYNQKNVFMRYLVYKEKDQYIERIYRRSKKVPVAKTTWDLNADYIKEYYTSLQEAKSSIDVNYFIRLHRYDEDISSIGCELLSFMGHHLLEEEFFRYSKRNRVCFDKI